MPSERIDERNNSILVLKKFHPIMDHHDNVVGHDQNNSQAELVVRSVEDNYSSNHAADGGVGGGSSPPPSERTIKDIKLKEWIVVFILCFVNLINYMDRFTLAGMLTEIQHHFDIKDDKGGLLQTAFVLSYMIFAPIFGYMGDRYSRRLIMAVGVFIWSFTTLLGSFMDQYWYFLLCRAMVGIGEASYSTIAPTIISDIFAGYMRSKMLALFYFAIPVGSGLGYIVGSETAKAFGSWKWGLRVTPVLGVIAVLLIVFVLKDPERGESDGSGHMEPTTWPEDVKDIVKNRSFMYSTAGFTCVTFVAGALAWWAPKFITMGLKLQSNYSSATADSDNVIALKFGVIAMISGIIGVPAGSALAQHLRRSNPRIDALICAFGLLISSPLIFLACITASYNEGLCFCFVFFGEFFLNMTWSLVADIVLYVVVPFRRSTAEGFQLLFSHAFGDAGSPYLIGVLSEVFQKSLSDTSANQDLIDFRSLQYALLITCFVEVLGSLFFLMNAFYIVDDKHKAEKAIHGDDLDDVPNTYNSSSRINEEAVMVNDTT